MSKIIYSNTRELFNELNKIEPELKNGLLLQRELKKIALDVANPIKQNIPVNAPLSGMNKPGRLSWQSGYNQRTNRKTGVIAKQKAPARKVDPSFSKKRSTKSAVTPLLKVVVKNPMVSILDYARKGRTPSGDSMLANVGGTASRYVWPAAIRALPQVEQDAKMALERAAQKINRKMR